MSNQSNSRKKPARRRRATPARIVVDITGGVVQAVFTNGQKVEVVVVDYDPDGVDPKDLITCPAVTSDEKCEVWATKFIPQLEKRGVNEVFRAVEQAARQKTEPDE